MPRNGSGVYSAPSLPGSFNPATLGQQATPADWTTLLTDLSNALSQSIAADGQTSISQDIPLNSHKITGLATGTAGTDAVNLTQVLALIRQVPVTKTSDFTVADTDLWIINNKAGSQLNVTLPSAAAFPGRVLHFQNYQAQPVVSVASNVRPLDGAVLTTGILSAILGQFATIVSDGTNWRVTQKAA